MFFWCWAVYVLYKFWILTPYQMYQWKCSPILWVVFFFCWWITLLCKIFLVLCSPICLFIFFVYLTWGDISDKKFAMINVQDFTAYVFSSRVFMVSGLTFKYLIYLEFILVCGVRRWSSFIFLHISERWTWTSLSCSRS